MKIMLISTVMLSMIGIAKGQSIWTNATKFKGTIGKYEIAMTLAVPYGGASACTTIGKYYYMSKKINIDICSQDDEMFIESVNGKETGYFILKNWDKKVGQTVIGIWHTMDGKKSFPVHLKVIGKAKG
jgi:hypothetical protein